MSIFRCVIGQHNVDSDHHEICEVDDIDICDDCFDKQKEKE